MSPASFRRSGYRSEPEQGKDRAEEPLVIPVTLALATLAALALAALALATLASLALTTLALATLALAALAP